jgi:Carboxypeptidase regulatory-like domain/Tetratricopeptide repeat
MRHLQIVLFLLTTFFVLGRPLAAQNGVDDPAQDRGSILGVVRDSATGRDVSDATVEVRASTGGTLVSGITDSSGRFTLDGVPPGAYTLTVQHPDYLSLTQSLTTDGRLTFGLQLSLRKKPAAPGAPSASPVEAPEQPAASSSGIPRAAQDAMNRGMDLLHVKSDARGSLDQFESAIDEYPGFYEAYTQIGLARISLGDSSDAEKAFRKAIELSQQKYPDAYAGLAVVLSDQKRFAAAEAAARKLIELNPNDWRGHGELARALHGSKQYQEAEVEADLAAKMAPDNPTLQLLRSSIHLQLKNLPAMLKDLDAYLKLVPSGPEADRMRDIRAKVQQAISAARPSQETTPPPSLR